DANTAAYLFVAVNAVASVLRSWILVPIDAGASSEVVSAGLLINALLCAAILIWSAVHWRKAIGKLIVTSLGWWGSRPKQERLIDGWLVIGLPLIILRSLVDVYGAIQGHVVEMTGPNIVVGVILAESLFRFLEQRLAAGTTTNTTEVPSHRLLGILMRAVRLV